MNPHRYRYKIYFWLFTTYSILPNQSHSAQVTAHNCLVGAFQHLTDAFAATHLKVFNFPTPFRTNLSSFSRQQLVHIFGQLSLTPRTNLHLQAVHFRFTQSWQVFCLTHPFSPGLVAVNDLVLSLQIEVGTGVNVDVGVDFFPVGVVVGMELLGVVVWDEEGLLVVHAVEAHSNKSCK